MSPGKIRKKPVMLIDAEVGSATRTHPVIMRVAVMVISFAERTLLNSFSMVV